MISRIRGWSVADDEKRIALIPPSDLDAQARKALLSVTAQQFRKYVNATGLIANAVSAPEVNLVVVIDAKPAPFPTAAVPLVQLLEPALVAQVGDHTYTSALASLKSIRVQLVATKDGGTSARARWTAALATPNWTSAQLNTWRRQTAQAGPAESWYLAERLRELSQHWTGGPDVGASLQLWASSIENRATRQPADYAEADWLEIAHEAALDAARRPALLAWLAERLGAVYAYESLNTAFLHHAEHSAGGAEALAVCRRLRNPRLVPLFGRPMANNSLRVTGGGRRLLSRDSSTT